MKLSLFCLTCWMIPFAIAQEEENAAPPEIASEATPELFRDAEAGFGLRLAGGFGFLARQESLVLFGSKDTPGMVFLELGETFSEQELIEVSRAGYADEGVALTPDGPAVPLDLGSAGTGRALLPSPSASWKALRSLLPKCLRLIPSCVLTLRGAVLVSISAAPHVTPRFRARNGSISAAMVRSSTGSKLKLRLMFLRPWDTREPETIARANGPSIARQAALC